jgi:hypothetical protein
MRDRNKSLAIHMVLVVEHSIRNLNIISSTVICQPLSSS